LETLLQAETERFVSTHPAAHAAHAAYERARGSQLAGVPMNWMTRWPGSYPAVVASAAGSRLTDVDGHTPFHLMALMSPAIADDDVPAHTRALREALAALVG